MKILVIGSYNPISLDYIYTENLARFGCEADVFEAQNIYFRYLKSSIFNKIINYLGWSGIHERINSELIEKVSSKHYDIVWIFKGMEIFPSTLLFMKEKGIKLVNFNPDNPFIFSGKGSGNSNVTESVGLYDLYLTYDRDIQEQLIKIANIQSRLLPFGFEIDPLLFERIKVQQEVNKACFVGNPDNHRAKFLFDLAERDVLIDVYGHGWNKFLKHKNLTIFPAVYNDEMWKTLRKYRVQLNYMRPHNQRSHNMRSFEVPGIGGIQLAPVTLDHRNFFLAGKEIFLFDSIENCALQINELLTLTATEADTIRDAARKRSLESGYSYYERTAQLMRYFNELIQ